MNPKTRVPGYGGITVPANAPSAITVGAVDTRQTVRRNDDIVAPFSSRGPTWIDGFAKPDVMAPGVGEAGAAAKGGKLYQTYPQLKFDDDDDNEFDEYKADEFARLSGTSMAAAEASGVVALVLEANHHLSPNAVKAVLEYTATPLADPKGQPYDALTQGLGEVNGAGAISVARLIDTEAPEGAPWLGAHETWTVFDNETQAWSQNIVWGNYYVKGLDSLFFNSEAWDDNIVWGTLGEDENIVWGSFATDENDNIVWGNLAVWGSLYDDDQDNIVWGNFARDDENIVWGTVVQADTNGDGVEDNIVWGNDFTWDDNIVWGNNLLGVENGDNIVWGNLNDDNIVWGNSTDDNIVWGNLADDNIVWGNSADGDNIVWGNSDDGDNVVWGTAILLGLVK
jgi:serine protease AprX